jgi:hypothetical protein
MAQGDNKQNQAHAVAEKSHDAGHHDGGCARRSRPN